MAASAVALGPAEPGPAPAEMAEAVAGPGAAGAPDAERLSVAASTLRGRLEGLRPAWLAHKLGTEQGTAEVYQVGSRAASYPSRAGPFRPPSPPTALPRPPGGDARTTDKDATHPALPHPSIRQRLGESVEQPSFLQRLAALVPGGGVAAPPAGTELIQAQAVPVDAEEFWDAPDGAAAAAAAASAEPLQEWQLVEREDVVAALADYIACYIMTQPEAQAMDPKALQSALTKTFHELHKSRVRRLWDWGKTLYRYSAVGYGAFGIYTNPWLARAALQALWTGSKVVMGAAAYAVPVL